MTRPGPPLPDPEGVGAYLVISIVALAGSEMILPSTGVSAVVTDRLPLVLVFLLRVVVVVPWKWDRTRPGLVRTGPESGPPSDAPPSPTRALGQGRAVVERLDLDG